MIRIVSSFSNHHKRKDNCIYFGIFKPIGVVTVTVFVAAAVRACLSRKFTCVCVAEHLLGRACIHAMTGFVEAAPTAGHMRLGRCGCYNVMCKLQCHV